MPQAIRSRDALRDHINHGHRVDYVFFWRHHPKDDARVGEECLSQWYPSLFEVSGVQYTTAEHYMMAEKARLFGDAETERRILHAKHPREAKRLGRSVKGFEDICWNRARFRIVVAGNVAKFSQHAELGAFLQSTGDHILVEASPRDTIWGIGLAAEEPEASNPNLWKGLNLLGFTLMEVRQILTSA